MSLLTSAVSKNSLSQGTHNCEAGLNEADDNAAAGFGCTASFLLLLAGAMLGGLVRWRCFYDDYADVAVSVSS